MKRSSSIIMGFLLGVSLIAGYRSFVFATAADHVDFTVDGIDYVVSERFTDDDLPAGFERETMEINGRAYSEPVSDNMTLLYLKPAADTSGSGEFYIYNESAGSVEKFHFLGTAQNYVVPLQGDPTSFTKLIETTVTVGDDSIPVYQLEGSTNDIYYVYGVDSNNEEEWYTYRESTEQVARADTYALLLTSDASTAETEEDEEVGEAVEKKESFLSKLSGDNTRNILIVVVIIVAIIIIFIINLRVFRRSDEDDDIWAEHDEDEDDVPPAKTASVKTAPVNNAPVKPAPVQQAPVHPAPLKKEAEVAAVSEPVQKAPASDDVSDTELPTEEAILKNAMAGIMEESAQPKVASAIDSLPKKSSAGNNKDEITMIDLNNL